MRNMLFLGVGTLILQFACFLGLLLNIVQLSNNGPLLPAILKLYAAFNLDICCFGYLILVNLAMGRYALDDDNSCSEF